MALDNIPIGTTSRPYVTITVGGEVPNISGDVVTLTIKAREDDDDVDAVYQGNGNVSTSGAEGIAIFTIDPADTEGLAPGQYHYDIVWYISTREYVIEKGLVSIVSRVSDI
ncbi:MAG: hypothetical protein JRJ85_26415 [Deltaproteobacteria bacterium]|nr:hypothetical protein [Deltaproteobacteria bacterium]